MHQTEIFRGLSICSKLQQVVRSGKIDVLALMLKFVIEACGSKFLSLSLSLSLSLFTPNPLLIVANHVW
jgi:hypothetical protein